MRVLTVAIPVGIFVVAMHLIAILDPEGDSPNGALPGIVFLVGFVTALGALCLLADARHALVKRKVITLAESRKEKLDDQRLFYNSPEWCLLRKQVIVEQGRRCRQCGRYIKRNSDLTIDHIKPRSKFPDLALKKSSLRVLCRQCNSSKGDAILSGTTDAGSLDDGGKQ